MDVAQLVRLPNGDQVVMGSSLHSTVASNKLRGYVWSNREVRKLVLNPRPSASNVTAYD